MLERTRKKRPRDTNQLAYDIVRESVGEAPPNKPEPDKNQAAVELGRKGGRKGGKVRASRMTAEQRREAARKAAKARWAKKASS